jgi:hypothetical protein
MKSDELMNRGYSSHYIPLALQLSNNNLDDAIMLLEKMDARANDLYQQQDNDSGSGHYSSREGLRTNLSFDSDNAIQDDYNDSLYETPDRRMSNASLIGQGRRDSSRPESISSRTSVSTVSYTPSEFTACSTCGDSSSGKSDQLVPCSNCHKFYHTFCFGGRRIPFSMRTESDRQSRDKYVAKHYGVWRCNSCPEANSDNRLSLGRNSLVGAGHDVLQGRRNSRPSLNSTLNLSALKNSGYGMSRSSSNRSGGSMPAAAASMSSHDQIAILLSILSSSGVTVESLLSMSEQQQRDTLIAATKFHNRNLSGSLNDDDSGGTDSYGIPSSRQSFDNASNNLNNNYSLGYGSASESIDDIGMIHNGVYTSRNTGGYNGSSSYQSGGNGASSSSNYANLSGGSSAHSNYGYRGLLDQSSYGADGQVGTGSVSGFVGMRGGNGGMQGMNPNGDSGTGTGASGFGKMRAGGILSSFGEQRLGGKKGLFGKLSGFGKEAGGSGGQSDAGMPASPTGSGMGGNGAILGQGVGGGGSRPGSGTYRNHFAQNMQSHSYVGNQVALPYNGNGSGNGNGNGMTGAGGISAPLGSPNRAFSDRVSPTSSFRKSTFRKLGADRFESYGSVGGDDDDGEGSYDMGIPLPSKQQMSSYLARRGSRGGHGLEKGESVKMKDDVKYGKYVKMVQVGYLHFS